MSHKMNDKFYEDLYELHEKAGLAYGGVDAEGETQWIGTQKQWENYQRLENDFLKNINE